MIRTHRLISGVAAVAMAATVILAVELYAQKKYAAEMLKEAPPAQDALDQGIDLTQIAAYHYVNERTLSIDDVQGRHFRMELTEDCPGLALAKTFSLVTESYRNLDHFIGIAISGRICTFKDFAPQA